MKDLTTLEAYRQREAEKKLHGSCGDAGNGIFKVYVHGKGFFVVASNGGGWEHISVTLSSKRAHRCPTWEEMCAIKKIFFEDEEVVVQYHPKKSEYVNNHEYCLHLWRPTTAEMPTPPVIMV